MTLCPLCNTSSTAFADWQAATEEYKRAMDAFLKPDASVRHAVTESTLALERRRACERKHDGDL